MNLTCEFCRRDRNNQNDTNWKTHRIINQKNKRQKVNLDGFFKKINKTFTCKYSLIK